MRTRVLLVALLPLLACSSGRVSLSGEITYAKTAEENYQAGQDELKKENWAPATKLFEHVRTKYPFSPFAALSELRIADAKFQQDRFVEAADAYTAFVTAHPKHEEADYAAFRAARARLNDAPGDFFMFPPSHEKDQKSLRVAVDLLAAFVKDRPQAKQAAEAKKLLDESRTKLMAHELYVAEFYWKREHWAGAALRYEGLLRDYPGSAQEPMALLRIGQCYARLDETFRAQQSLQRLIARYPEDPHRVEAEKLLGKLH